MTRKPLTLKKQLVIAVLSYVAWVFIYTYFDTQSERNTLYKDIDRQLVSAALTAPLLLPPSLHHQGISKDDITIAQDERYRHRLSEYTDTHDVIYIYTLILQDNKVLFTSSSATQDERESGEGISYFFDEYDDVDPRVVDVFNTQQNAFLEYTDQWGTFRSVFIPQLSADGTPYVTAADISISHIDALLNRKTYRSVLVAALFLVFIYPLYRVATKREKALVKTLDAKVKQQTTELIRSEQRLKQALLSANQEWFEINVVTGEMHLSDESYLWKSSGEKQLVCSFEQWLKRIHPDDRDTTKRVYRHAVNTGQALTMVYRFRSFSDKWVWVQSTGEIVEWDQHRLPLRMVGINTDITIRKLADEALTNRQNQIIHNHKALLELGKEQFASQAEAFNKIVIRSAAQLDVARASIWLLNEDNSVMSCQSLFHEGTVSNANLNLAAHDYPQYFTTLMENGFISASDAESHPATAEFAEGYLAPLGITSLLDTPIRIQGKIIGIVCHEHIGPKRVWSIENEEFAKSIADLCAQEILEFKRKTAETELNKYKEHLEDLVNERTAEMKQARDEAERANKAKSEFLSAMSHELRTPLNSILGFTQLLETQGGATLSNEQKESLSYVKQGGKLLLELINEVLDLSRIETGNLHIQFNILDVTQLVSEVISMMQSEADNATVSLINQIDKTMPLYINADYTKLKQVLINLASNAIKYNHETGQVSFVGSITAEHKVRLEVSDTGDGVPNELLSAMFEPFNRLTKANSSIAGTGIGLTICKQLVELMEGEIGVTNNPDGGLTVWLEFDEVQPDEGMDGCGLAV